MGNSLKKITSITLSGLLLLTCCMTVIPVEDKATQEALVIECTTKPEEKPEEYKDLHPVTYNDEQEEIRDEILYGELELLAQLIQAEAGNQDELGKRYVADVVLNRVDDEDFPDTIEEVIYQTDPIQFACVVDGNLDKAAWTVTEDCFEIALEEYESKKDHTIIYFRTDKYSDCGHPAFKYGNHYFSTK